MERHIDLTVDAPTTRPVDAEEERARLIRDAAAVGVDEAAAIDLAKQVARIEPLPAAYRSVDRRLATGYTVDEARDILLGDALQPADATA
jgi:hypothetical protein